MNDLLALAEQCEKATHSSRLLDHSIWQAIDEHSKGGDKSELFWAPHYTGSLDCAFSLVPARLNWRVCNMTGLPGAIVCVPNAWLSAKTAPKMYRGATPVLALCVAALHARADHIGDANDMIEKASS